jgi:hypothetical protein
MTPLPAGSPEHKKPHNAVMRHVSAARAFHTGLIAETHRHLHVLRRMARYIDVLRRSNRRATEKLTAAAASCRELRSLEELKRPWQDLHRDFRYHLRRAHALLRRIVRTPE